jgi:probable addiction module antidote protein
MKGMHETFSRYDTAEYLKTEADIAAYLEACAEEASNNAAFMLKALGTVARAHRLALVPDRD